MGIFENTPPKWDAKGTEPSADLQTNGFTAGYKPPAAYFNFLFNKITACITELQAFLKGVEPDTYATKSTKQSIVIMWGNWTKSDVAPFEQTHIVAVGEDISTKNIEVILPESITAEEVAAYQSAQILNAKALYDGYNTKITLYCYGTQPTINLNATVIIRGD